MTTDSGCLDDALLDAIFAGRADASALQRAHAHAAHCEPCTDLLAAIGQAKAAEQTTAGSDIPLPDPLGPMPGDRIGRFVIERTLGQGGMGIVLAATDPTLRRTIALKVIRSRDHGASETRLLREARAMATVRHPNVVTVHEVGVDDGRIFLVMDYIDGSDLRAWLTAEPRGWRAILQMFIAAGRGLAAAHDKGLVHRDFKPPNVLVDRSGRVQVTDFGLVTTSGAAVGTAAEGDASTGGGDAQSVTGTLAGTPRYMAPETLARGEVTPLSDQYSFCVALFESIVGEHPYGPIAEDRLGRALTNELTAVPGAAMPRRLARALEIGLQAVPDRRHPDMGALLHQLERIEGEAGRRRRLAAVAVLVAAAVGGGVWMGNEGPPCRVPDPAADFAEIWNEPRRDALASAVGASSWPRFAATVDAYTHGWTKARAEACEATRVRGEVSDELFDRRMACLSERRAALAASLEIVQGGRAPRSSIEIVYGLPPLAACDDLERLAAEAPRPDDPELNARIDALRVEEVRATALIDAGLSEDAIEVLLALRSEARAVGWAPIEAVIVAHLSLVHGRTDPRLGLETWREAYAKAVEAGDEGLLFNLELGGVEHHLSQGMLEQAAFLYDVAVARGERLGITRARRVLQAQATLARVRGDLEQAEVAYRELVHFVESDPALASDVGDAYGDLGAIALQRGRLQEAATLMDKAVAASEDAYGPSHPNVITWRANRAELYRNQGDLVAAERELRELRELADPAQQPMIASHLGVVLRTAGRADEALELDREAYEGFLDKLGASHPSTVGSRTALSRDLVALGRPDEAARELQEEVERSPAGARTVGVLLNLGVALQEAGNLEAAIAVFEDGRAILEGADHAELDRVQLEYQLGMALLKDGRPDDAVVALERADRAATVLVERAGSGALPMQRAARVRFGLARARQAQGADALATALAQQARALLRRGEVDPGPLTAEIDAWLGANTTEVARKVATP